MMMIKRIGMVLGILLVLGIILVSIIHIPSVQMVVWSKIQDHLRSEYNIIVEADSLKFSLFSGLQAEIRKLKILGGPQNQQQFAIADIVRVYAPLSILWSSDKIVEKIQIENPDVNADYPPNLREQGKQEDSGTFEIKAIEILGGKARFAQYQIDELQLNSSLEGNALVIKNLITKAYGATLQANGRINDIASLRYDLSFNLNGDASVVKALAPEAPSVTGPIAASGKIGGSKSDIVIEGTAQSSNLRLEQSSPFQAQGQYRINMAEKLRPFDIELRWADLPVSAFQKFVPQLPSVASFSNGTLHYKGGSDPFAAEGTITTQLKPGGTGVLPVAGNIQGNLTNGSLVLRDSNLAFHSSSATFSGTVYQNSLNMDVQAKIGRMSDLAVFSPDLRKIPGSYRVNAAVEGPFKDLILRGVVNGAGSGMNLTANGSFQTGSELIDATVRGNFDGSALRMFDVGNVAGNFELDTTIRGSVSSPKLDGTLNGNNVYLNDIAVGSVNAEFNSDGRTLYAKADIPEFASVVNGSYVWKTSEFQVDATASDLNTEQIRPLLPATASEVTGTVNATLHAVGNAKRWRNADAELKIESAKLTWNDFPIELESGSGARMEQGVVTANLSSKIGSGNATLNGTYRLSDNQYKVSGNLDNIRIDEIRPLAPQIPPDLNGNITASINATGNAKNWKDSEAEVQFQEAFFTKENLEIRVRENSTMILRDRMLNADLNVILPEGQFVVQGKLPIEGTSGADLRITGQADLKIASMFTQEFVLSGKSDIDLRVQGNLTKPQISGDIKAENFVAQMPSRQLVLRGDSLNARFSGEEIQLSLNGALNDSGLKVEGVVPLTEARERKYQYQSGFF